MSRQIENGERVRFSRRALGWAALVCAGAAVVLYLPDRDAPSALAGAASPAKPASGPTAPEPRLQALPAREALGPAQGEPFAARDWAPPAKPVLPPTPPAAAPPIVAVAPVAPQRIAPAVPYRVAGEVMHDDAAYIVLARGDSVHVVRQGERLEGGYRVEAIRPDRVTLLYEPLGTRDELPVGSTDGPAAATGPVAQAAQLRWDGPAQVHAGSTFEVALKLSSIEPLRAVPLQLQYDAAVLEPVHVKAGRYFSDGSFSYRVNPGGSIFIGASGKGVDATDAELFVVSFKPVGYGITELKLSSVLLQSAGGRTIAYQQPATFRTAVVR